MTGIFIQSTDSTAEISANSYYGADFKVHLFDHINNEYLIENKECTEISEPLNSDISTTVVGNFDKGETIIELDSVQDLSVSDRVKVNNYIYKIVNISNNNITLHTPLYENVSDSDTVVNKGNLGIYKVQFNIDNLGEFTLIGKDSLFGLYTTRIIKVIPKSLETMYKDIKNLEYAILGS